MEDIPAGMENLEAEIIVCRACPRLTAWREQVAQTRRRAFRDQEYWGKPVPGFGDPQARLMIVGLAPGAHGSNRTGRMFTGDASGDFLYPALYATHFANRPAAVSRGDGLQLHDLFITAVCRCVPPDNKPTSQEIATCMPFLARELSVLTHLEGIVALGKIAFDQMLAFYARKDDPALKVNFGHGVFVPARAGRPWILASYHPSRQNTQTGRLTPEMFAQIWTRARELLDSEP
jgi:uracil-DNA glycosylase family 4